MFRRRKEGRQENGFPLFERVLSSLHTTEEISGANVSEVSERRQQLPFLSSQAALMEQGLEFYHSLTGIPQKCFKDWTR